MGYKNFLYKLSSRFSPDFYVEIIDLISNKNNLTIFDIGFYNGEFTKKLIENLDIDKNKKNIFVYSFDPNSKINRKEFKEFAELNNINWEHFNNAIGNKNSKEKFTILKSFPSSGSSINNILVSSMWLKSRRFIFSPFSRKSDMTEVFEVTQKTLDSIELDIESIDVLKIDVEGYSYEVLKGAKNTIENFLPLIQLEILAKKRIFEIERNKIINFLEEIGYEFVKEKKHTTTHIFSDVMCTDLLFIPKKII